MIEVAARKLFSDKKRSGERIIIVGAVKNAIFLLYLTSMIVVMTMGRGVDKRLTALIPDSG